MSWVDFYNEEAHLGNVFGERGPFYGPQGHLGVDWNGHEEGTSVPSWTAGIVVVVAFSQTLGWLVIVRRANGTFAGFCHLLRRPAVLVGTRITVGFIVGLLGSSGSFSDGAHLHCTLEPTVTIGTQNAIDPLPAIRAAVAAAKPQPVQEDTMKYIWNGETGAKARYALIDVVFEKGFLDSTLEADANGFSGMAPMPGAPHVRKGAHFDRTLYYAEQARAAYLASQSQVTIGSLTLDAATIAALAEANAKAFFVEQKKAGN